MNSLTPTKSFIIGLIAAGLCYFFVFNDAPKLNSELKRVTAENKNYVNELNKLKQSISEAQKYQRTKEELGETINKIVKFIPQDLNESKMTIKLTSAANEAGVNILNVQKGQTTREQMKKGLYKEIPVNIKLEGTFSQIMKFLSSLTKLDNIVTIKKFDLSKSRSQKGAGLIEFTSTFVGYRYMEKEEKSEIY